MERSYQSERQKKPFRKNFDKKKPFSRDQKRSFQKTSPENCPIQKLCGSCLSVNENYKKSSEKKYDAALELIKNEVSLDSVKCIPLELSPREKAYRNSVKLAVREVVLGSGKRYLDLGLFSRGSHKLVSLKKCYIQNEEINALLEDLKTLLIESKIPAYSEETHSGSLRYILARASHKTKELSLTFVTKDKSCLSKLRQLTQKLHENHNITSAFLNLNSEKTNRITGNETKKIFGQDALRENLCHFDLRVSPLSFFQVNPYTASKIYERVEQLVGKTSFPGTLAWDLYCGVGIFSLILMRQGYTVLGVEENPSAIKDAKINAHKNFPETPSEFKEAKVEDFIEEQKTKMNPEAIVINPSRRGLHETVREKLCSLKRNKTSSNKLIYVSCEAKSLARDLKVLTENGYTLRQVECFDMFPHTDKLEWLCVLT